MSAIAGRVLEDLSQAELLAFARRMQEKAERAANRKLSLKVSEKGAVSLYGMGRWPVTLYRSQWERLLSNAEEIKLFLLDNAEKLSEKE